MLSLTLKKIRLGFTLIFVGVPAIALVSELADATNEISLLQGTKRSRVVFRFSLVATLEIKVGER